MKPIIGITVDAKHEPENARTQGTLTLNWNYAQVIADAGGVPLLIPPQADAEALARIIDGWLIPGGNDIDPSYWGEDTHEKTDLINPERHRIERELYEKVPPEMPILGVCYGCQFLNVAAGGSLIQHLPDITGHDQDQKGNLQTYCLEKDSQTASVLGTVQASGQSWHHQAIGRVAPGLKVSGKNDDGTIEAIESTSRPWVIGVQWHPERTAQADDSRSLFHHFVEAARMFGESRP